MSTPQQVNVSTEQVAKACMETAKLLQNDDRVNVPPSMAMDGSLALAVGILTSLANGQAILTNPPEEAAPVVNLGGDDKGSPEKEDASAEG